MKELRLCSLGCHEPPLCDIDQEWKGHGHMLSHLRTQGAEARHTFIQWPAKHDLVIFSRRGAADIFAAADHLLVCKGHGLVAAHLNVGSHTRQVGHDVRKHCLGLFPEFFAHFA
jgi:hypothetical protein